MLGISIHSLLKEREKALGAFGTVLRKLEKSNAKLNEFISKKKEQNSTLQSQIQMNDADISYAQDAVTKTNQTMKNINSIIGE